MKNTVLGPCSRGADVLVEFIPIPACKDLSVEIPEGYRAALLTEGRDAVWIGQVAGTVRIAPYGKEYLRGNATVAFVHVRGLSSLAWGFGNVPVKNESRGEVCRVGLNGLFSVEIGDMVCLKRYFGRQKPVTVADLRDTLLPAIKGRGVAWVGAAFSEDDLSVFDLAAVTDRIRKELFEAVAAEPILAEVGVRLKDLTVSGVYVNDEDLEVIRARTHPERTSSGTWERPLAGVRPEKSGPGMPSETDAGSQSNGKQDAGAVPSENSYRDTEPPRSAREIWRQNLEGVVELFCRFGDAEQYGTGFFVSSDGYLLTNAHVVISRNEEDKLMLAESILCSGPDPDLSAFPQVVFADAKNDLALLKIDGTDFLALQLTESLPEVGDKVYAIGNSRGEGLSFVDGIVGDLDRVFNGHPVFLFNALVSTGCSGGPIFNDRGEVCGVTVGQFKDTPGMNYGIPHTVLSDFLDSAEKKKGIRIGRRQDV